VACAGEELEMDNSGWLGFSLSSSSAAARGYGDGGGEGGGGSGGDGGSCSSPTAAAAGSPVVGVPLHSGGSAQYDGQGNYMHMHACN
jgi:hypothetical protein